MPTRAELDDYLKRRADVPRIDRDPRLNHLHRVTTRRGEWPELCALAFDHRKQLEELGGLDHEALVEGRYRKFRDMGRLGKEFLEVAP